MTAFFDRVDALDPGAVMLWVVVCGGLFLLELVVAVLYYAWLRRRYEKLENERRLERHLGKLPALAEKIRTAYRGEGTDE